MHKFSENIRYHCMQRRNFPSPLFIYWSMEILLLILLYALSQSADFPDSVRPVMDRLKNSEELLKFLDDLSRFTEMFSAFSGKKTDPPTSPPHEKPNGKEDKKPPEKESPTSGFADKFIEECLEKYFKKH